MTDQTKNAAPDTPEMKAVGAFLAAMHDNRLDGAKVREAMLWALGAVPLFPEAAQEAPLPVAAFTESEINENPRLKFEPEQWVRRDDGKVVRVDRWEWGIRAIVSTLWGNRHEFEISEVVEAVEALDSPASARPLSEGWKLVPVEPTKEMIDAGHMHTVRADEDEPYRARGEAIACYMDMLDAAPAPSALGGSADQEGMA